MINVGDTCPEYFPFIQWDKKFRGKFQHTNKMTDLKTRPQVLPWAKKQCQNLIRISWSKICLCMNKSEIQWGWIFFSLYPPWSRMKQIIQTCILLELTTFRGKNSNQITTTAINTLRWSLRDNLKHPDLSSVFAWFFFCCFCFKNIVIGSTFTAKQMIHDSQTPWAIKIKHDSSKGASLY